MNYMKINSFIILNKKITEEALDFSSLIEELTKAIIEYEQGEIYCSKRSVTPLGEQAVMLSMPAVAEDIAVHKLINVVPNNKMKGVDIINGHLSAYDTQTGYPLFIMDGPVATGRRTAALSMLGIKAFIGTPQEILLIGTGIQATYHLKAIAELYPSCKVWVKGSTAEKSKRFCLDKKELINIIEPLIDDIIPSNINVIITLTTSLEPVYNLPAEKGLLVIAVGAFKPEMAEIGPLTLADSLIYLDDLIGAKQEAGDLIQANIDWNRTSSLASFLSNPVIPNRPIVFKTVGTGAWDLAVARAVKKRLNL